MQLAASSTSMDNMQHVLFRLLQGNRQAPLPQGKGTVLPPPLILHTALDWHIEELRHACTSLTPGC